MPARRPFRPCCTPELLEPRVVLSHATAHVAVAAAVPTPTTTATTTTTDPTSAALAAAGATINADYANFAAAIRQAEINAFPTDAYVAPPSNASVLTGVSVATGILAAQVESALDALPGAATDAAVVAAGIDGASSGSLATQLAALFNAADDARIGGLASFLDHPAYAILNAEDRPTFYTVVEDTLASSLQATSVQTYLTAAAGSTPSSTAAANLKAIAAAVNPEYATFAATAHQATGLIQQYNYALPEPMPSTTLAPLGSTLSAAVTGLNESLTADLTGTPVAPITQLLQGQIVGQPGTLAERIADITTAIKPVAVGTFYDATNATETVAPTAYDVAINSSYESISIEGYIIGTSRSLAIRA